MSHDADMSDELQDWRFLKGSDKSNFSVPKRGEKDFEPDGTQNQKTILSQSREAMYMALDCSRSHAAKNHIRSTWYAEVGMALVDVPRGPHFQTIGRADSQGRVWLSPEETVYLVERGSMECWWPQGAPMSLQAVYACCISSHGDLENQLVYSYLKKVGFIVHRHSFFVEPAIESETRNSINSINSISLNIYVQLGLRKVLDSLEWLFLYPQTYNQFWKPWKRPTMKTLLTKILYRNYNSVFDDLQIIPCYNPTKLDISVEVEQEENSSEPLSIMYNVWKPTDRFKKSNPGPADFQIVVLSARQTTMPTLAQIAQLFKDIPLDLKVESQSQIQRLKNGWKSIIIAVVDSGVVNFVRVSDVAFGRERIYSDKSIKKRSSGKSNT